MNLLQEMMARLAEQVSEVKGSVQEQSKAEHVSELSGASAKLIID
jgi:hypothetical protein